MDKTRSSVGGRIRQARIRRGLLQRELAARVGVSERAVRAWEKSTRMPQAPTARLLALELGVSVGWLLEGPAHSTGHRGVRAPGKPAPQVGAAPAAPKRSALSDVSPLRSVAL